MGRCRRDDEGAPARPIHHGRSRAWANNAWLGCVLGAVALIVGACERRGPASTGAVRAVVTVPALAGIVKPLLPEGSELTVLMKPGRSEHGYELTPTDIAALGRADLVVYVGMGLEPQVRAFVDRQKSDRRRVVCFGEVVGLQKPGEVRSIRSKLSRLRKIMSIYAMVSHRGHKSQRKPRPLPRGLTGVASE